MSSGPGSGSGPGADKKTGKDSDKKPTSKRSGTSISRTSEESSARASLAKANSAKANSAKANSVKANSAKANSAKSNSAKVNSAKVDSVKEDSEKVDSAKEDSAKEDSAKVGSAKEDSAKVGSAKKNSAKIGSAKKDSAKVDSAKEDSAKEDSAKENFAKVDFAKANLIRNVNSTKTNPAKSSTDKSSSERSSSDTQFRTIKNATSRPTTEKTGSANQSSMSGAASKRQNGQENLNSTKRCCCNSLKGNEWSACQEKQDKDVCKNVNEKTNNNLSSEYEECLGSQHICNCLICKAKNESQQKEAEEVSKSLPISCIETLQMCCKTNHTKQNNEEMPSTSTNDSSKLQSMNRDQVKCELKKSLLQPNKTCAQTKTIPQYSAKERLLIEDNYFPGLIEDCVAGCKDFNSISFGISFEDTQKIPKELPAKTPMTLLEAFYKRIDSERTNMSDTLSTKLGFQELNKDSVDLYFTCKPRTQLNEALAGLFKAEAIYEESVKQSQNPGSTPYSMEVERTELPLVGNCPITVECFTGTTTPIPIEKPAPKQRVPVTRERKI